MGVVVGSHERTGVPAQLGIVPRAVDEAAHLLHVRHPVDLRVWGRGEGQRFDL